MKELRTPGIRFIVSSLCNYDCVYCHNEWELKKGPISKLEEKLINELIFAAKELGSKEVDITGGEPLLKIDRVEAAELIDNKIAMHASNQTSYSNVSGARLETKVENIEKKLTTVESDVKEILKRVG